MKLRLLPILMTVLVSSLFMFGGWFLYDSYALENPLSDIASREPGVQQVSVNLTTNRVMVQVTLKNDVDLRHLYNSLRKEGASIIGDRELVLNITSDSAPELEQWWASALFDVAQAMETRHYASIPTSLQARAMDKMGLQVFTQMDEYNVYVYLKQNTQSKYVILPRIPAKMGVWTNE